jgi:hypothetical protein
MIPRINHNPALPSNGQGCPAGRRSRKKKKEKNTKKYIDLPSSLEI